MSRRFVILGSRDKPGYDEICLEASSSYIYSRNSIHTSTRA